MRRHTIDDENGRSRKLRLRRAGGFLVWRASAGEGATCIGRVASRKLAKQIAGAYDWIEDAR